MKVIDINDFHKYDFYVKELEINKISPNKVVDDFLYQFTPKCHFVYGYNGNARYWTEDGSVDIEITPGTLAYIPYSSKIHFSEDENFEYYKVYFNIYLAETNEHVLFSEKAKLLTHDIPYEVSSLISEFSIFLSSNPYSRFKNLAYLYSLIEAAGSLSSPKHLSPAASKLAPALLYMTSYYNKEFTTEMLADICNLSEPYFRAIFKKHLGITPTEYKNILRIKYACDLLTSTNYSVGDIASQTGFHNVQYFCTIFKKVMGYNPSEHRTKTRNVGFFNLDNKISIL